MRRGLSPPEPTPTEAFIQREFGAAVALAAQHWRDFVEHSSALDRDWERKFTLRQRLLAFMVGPILPTLEAQFPEIRTFAEQADALTDFAGHEEVVLMSIVGEGVIASGTNSREEVRTAVTPLA
jgi:hypothetical protein